MIRHHLTVRCTWPALLITAVALLPSANASAQRGLDRGLTTSRAARAGPEVIGEEPRGHLVAPQPAADTVVKASWRLQPLGTVSGRDNEFGLLAGYENENRYGSWPWLLTIRGLRRLQDGTAHAGWQADGEIYPPIGPLGTVQLEAMIAATHVHTIDVGRSDGIAAELDVVLRGSTRMKLSVGAIGYYAWESPRAREASHGVILGLIGFWRRGRFDLLSEYDFSSDLAGEDSYSVAGSYRITGDSAKKELRLRGGWEKGDTYSLRLQLAMPHNKVKARSPLGF